MKKLDKITNGVKTMCLIESALISTLAFPFCMYISNHDLWIAFVYYAILFLITFANSLIVEMVIKINEIVDYLNKKEDENKAN